MGADGPALSNIMMRKQKILLVIALAVVVAFVLGGFAWMKQRQERLDGEIQAAAALGEFERVLQLLKEGADPAGDDHDPVLWGRPNDPKPPVWHAVSNDEREVVRALVAAGLDLGQDGLGERLLLEAMKRSHLEMYALLLELGADPNGVIPNHLNCYNTLHWAVQQARGEPAYEPTLEMRAAQFARLALDAGADPNHRGGWHGYTPLLFALQCEKGQLAEMYLKAGADITIRDDSGKNAMDTAAFLENPKLIRLIEKHGGKRTLQKGAVKDE